MKRTFAQKIIAFLFSCCVLAVILPGTTAKAEVTYLQTLKYNHTYTIKNGGGCRQFDLDVKKTGCITINYLAKEAKGMTRICVYDKENTTKLFQRDFTGSFQCDLNLKAGKYTLHVTLPWNNGCWERTPAEGSMKATFKSVAETYPETIIKTNDEQDTASKIGTLTQKKITGQFAINDSVDYYKFTIKKDQKVKISFSSSLTSVSMQLYKNSLDYKYTNADLKAGTRSTTLALPKGTYYLAFTNNKTDVTGKYSLKLSASNINAVSLKSVKSNSPKKVTVTYGKSNIADKYMIQIATNSSFTKGAKTYLTDSTSVQISNLKSKKVYYVRVRTLTYANDLKCYSEWSKSKKVTVK